MSSPTRVRRMEEYEPMPLGTVRVTVDKVEHGRGGHHHISAIGVLAGGGMVRVDVRLRCARRHVPYIIDDEFDIYLEPRAVAGGERV